MADKGHSDFEIDERHDTRRAVALGIHANQAQSPTPIANSGSIGLSPKGLSTDPSGLSTDPSATRG